jgi:hypothetical protein
LAAQRFIGCAFFVGEDVDKICDYTRLVSLVTMPAIRDGFG